MSETECDPTVWPGLVRPRSERRGGRALRVSSDLVLPKHNGAVPAQHRVTSASPHAKIKS